MSVAVVSLNAIFSADFIEIYVFKLILISDAV